MSGGSATGNIDVDVAARALAESWLGLAGPRAADRVADRHVCDRCARELLVTIGLAARIGPAEIARMVACSYGAALRDRVSLDLVRAGVRL